MAEGTAEAAAAAACFSEDDFYCPVCQEVFKTPVRTANCQHVWVFLPAPKPPALFTRLPLTPSGSLPVAPLSPAPQRTDPREPRQGSCRAAGPAGLVLSPLAAPGTEAPPPRAGAKARVPRAVPASRRRSLPWRTRSGQLGKAPLEASPRFSGRWCPSFTAGENTVRM